MLCVLVAGFAYKLILAEDKSVFMPGELTGGHYQIGVACDACHVDAFSDADAMQQACEQCHGEQRKKPFDSHPRAKFTDPRNADRLANIDARYCVSCHVEHKPQITQQAGVTQPTDFCVHCHRDVAKDRPSHEGMAFDTCNSAGCHNFHNNRALYTDFLVKHMQDPDLLEQRTVPEREFVNVLDEIVSYPRDRYPVNSLMLKDMDAPAKLKVSDELKHDWLTTAHATAGANCSACHMSPAADGEATKWTDRPDHTACAQCHDVEVKHFMRGKHGMRLQQGLPPMTPGQARLPMRADAAGQPLDCNACHRAHDYSLVDAAVDACLACHADEHSLAYKNSSHYSLWQQEQAGALPAGSGVSCASCHMPRVSVDVSDWLQRIVVQHNQNATLVPNEKMIRPACMNCHGLGFSIDALADEALVRSNFQGRPAVHIESIDMARRDNERYLQETGGERH
jgi:predicted CXXCH cytochrome family protein